MLRESKYRESKYKERKEAHSVVLNIDVIAHEGRHDKLEFVVFKDTTEEGNSLKEGLTM